MPRDDKDVRRVSSWHSFRNPASDGKQENKGRDCPGYWLGIFKQAVNVLERLVAVLFVDLTGCLELSISWPPVEAVNKSALVALPANRHLVLAEVAFLKGHAA